MNEFRSALNPKTRLVILNTPHNPTGKVFTWEELIEITDLLDEFPNAYIISDEVYDFLTFDEREHVMFANLKNNWEKTITVFSGGK
jgi:kynurenine aminotransferase